MPLAQFAKHQMTGGTEESFHSAVWGVSELRFLWLWGNFSQSADSLRLVAAKSLSVNSFLSLLRKTTLYFTKHSNALEVKTHVTTLNLEPAVGLSLRSLLNLQFQGSEAVDK